MKVRIISQEGHAVAFVDRMAMDVETQWNTPPGPDTVILFDQPGHGAMADMLRQKHPVYGASRLHDALELNPDFGRKIAETAGIKTQVSDGPRMTIDAFYVNGQRLNILVSSLGRDGNAFYRIWKKSDPRIYKDTLARIEGFLRQFHYTGSLSCECSIAGPQHHASYVRWISHLQPHVLWAVSPLLPVILGLEQLNGQAITYRWVCIVTISDGPSYLSIEHSDLNQIKKILRTTISAISTPGKSFVDNLDDLHKDIEILKQWKYL